MATVTIDGVDYPVTLPPDWEFEEALTVRRLTGLRPGGIFEEIVSGGADVAALMCAIVALMRAGEDPAQLLKMKQSSVKLDLRDEIPEADRPPAAGAPEAPAASDEASPSPPSE